MPRIFEPGTTEPKPRPSGPHRAARPPSQQDDYSRRIGIGQANSSNLVPVRTIIDLANLNANDRDIAITARRMARSWDVSPHVFFGQTDPRKVVSQITGQPVSMKEAQRFTDYYSPVAIAQMLQSMEPTPTVTVTANGEPRGGRLPPGPSIKKVSEWANVLSRQFDLPLTMGLSLARYLAARNINAKTFEHNIPVVRTWLAGVGADPTDVQKVVQWAANSTTKGKLNTVEEFQTALFGEGTAELSQRAQAAITQGITYGTPEQRAAAAQGELTNLQTIQAQGGGIIPGQVTESGMLTEDYWQQALALQEQVRLSQDAFQNSLLGKVTHWTGVGFAKLWEGTELGLGNIGYAAATPLSLALGAVPGGPSANDVLHTIQASRQDFYRRIEAGQTVGDIVQEGWGNAIGVDIPDWVGTAFDFWVQWELDPTVLFGKVSKLSRAERLLPELEQPSLLRTALGNIGISRAELRLGRDALAAGDDALNELALKTGTSVYSLRQLPTDVLERTVGGMLNRGPETLKLSGVFGAIAKRNDVLLDLATQRWKNYVINDLPGGHLSESLFDAAKEGGVAFSRRLDRVSIGTVVDRTLDYTYMKLLRDEILKRFPDMGDDAWQAWQDGMRAHYVGWGPEGSAAEAAVNARIYGMRADVKTLADNIPESFNPDYALGSEFVHDTEFGLWHPPFTAEAPAGGRMAEFGLRRNVRSLMTNERFTETGFGKKVAALPNINPGRQMPLFGTGAEQYTLAHARRWATFSESEVRAYQARALRLLGHGAATEKNLDALITEMNDEAFRRIVKPFNLTPAAEGNLRDEIFDPIRRYNYRERTFGVRQTEEGPVAIEAPVLESQLRNYLTVIDPVQVRAAIREYTGVTRRMRAHFYNALRKDAPEIAGKLDNIAHRTAVTLMTGTGEALNDFRHIWKALVIARPGYVPRVVLGDENARFLSVTQSIMERTLAAEWYGGVKRLNRRDIFTQTFRDSEGNVIGRVGLPGAYEMNPLATNEVRDSELLNDLLRTVKLRDKAHNLGDISWDLLRADENQARHMTGWVWALNKQFPNSAPGRVALESVAAGEDLARTQERLIEWAKADDYVTLHRDIGVPTEGVDDWANDVAMMAHTYTLGNADIATAALTADAKDLRQVLENANIPVSERPVIHGPSVTAETRGAGYSIGSRAMNKMYDTFVRWPETHMNRQPFYKAMKRRAERGYYALLEDAAKTDPAVAKFLRGEFEPRILNPESEVRGLGEASDEFYYHLSPASNIESISTKGVFPRQSTYGIPLDRIPPEMRGGRAFVADSPDIAMNATRSVGDKALIRIPRSDVPTVFDDPAMAGSHFARSSVPTTNAEILGEDGAWHPILETKREVSGLNPTIRKAIDGASDEFALDQVSRVMFDFTKQSRFTELLQFIFPFPQPFFEGFQAWGHLIHRDPGIIGRANALYRAGVNSGWIKQDEITGQTVVDLRPLRWGAVQAAGLFGMKDRVDGLELVAPLANFNMLASSTLRLPTDTGGVFGKIAGGAPIPVPSLRPEIQALAQWAFRNNANESITSYLFQYGAGTTFLPKSLQSAARIFAPQMFQDDTTQVALSDSLLRAYQVNHVRISWHDADGNPITTGFDDNGDPINEDYLLDAVNHDATRLLQTRAVLSLFSPASPSIRTAATPYETMWQDYLDQAKQEDPKNFYRIASDRWATDHPDLWLIPIGKTLQVGDIVDPRTGKTVAGPRLPASKLVMSMLNTPGIGDLMKRDKAWAGLFLIGLDPEVADSQDWPTFARLVANNTFRYRTPAEFFGTGETGRVWRDINDFYTNTWNPGRAAMDAKGEDTNDVSYLDLQKARRTFLTGLFQRFPGWVRSHLQYNDAGQYWDWPESTPDIPTNITLAQARSIVEAPGFGNFPGVQALQKFLDLHDQTQEQMKRAGYTSILQDSAVSDGFTTRFANKVKAIIDDTPGIEPYLSAMFGIRLGTTEIGGRGGETPEPVKTVTTLTSSDVLTTLPSAKYNWYARLKPELQDAAKRFDTHIEVLKQNAYSNYDSDVERSQRYLDLQLYMDDNWTQHPGLVKAWWNSSYTPQEQEQYRQDLATKPAIFYTAFDWHLMGVDLNKDSVKAFQEVAKARIQIAKNEQADPKYSAGDAYDALNVSIAARAKANKNFAKALDVANDWTVPLRAAELEKLPGKAGYAWGQLIEATKQLEGAVVGGELVGPSGFGNTDAQNAWYRDAQKAVLRYVDYYKDPNSDGYNQAFAQSWSELTGAINGPIVGTIILPDTYYGPLGRPNYG